MDTRLFNKDGLISSLQVSFVKDVPKGDFSPGLYFLLKNITDDNITVRCIPAGMDEEIETVIYPGWNPELIKKVINSPSGLQYGY